MAPTAKAAGLILGGVPADEAEAGKTVVEYARAGIRAFLLPGALLGDPARAAAIAAMARRAAEEAGAGPALVAAGGDSMPRFGLPYAPQVPTPLCLAAAVSPRSARRAGRVLGSIASACGIDMILGPRLDLATDPKDAAGALDLFGADPRTVGALGSSYARGIAEGGAAACFGRFPGLGSTCRADCGEGLPLVDALGDRLSSCEMRPFMKVVATGAAAMLVGRALVPALEADRLPASRSARVIEGILRSELRFRGIVIGDDGTEDADKGRSALLGALAGCDLCLYSSSQAALEAAAALELAAASGELPNPRIEASRKRLDDFLRIRSRSPREAPRSPSAAELQKAAADREAGFCRLGGSLVLNAAATGNYKGVIVILFSPPPLAPEAAEAQAAAQALREALPGAHVATVRADPEPGDAEALTLTLERAGGYAEAAILTYDAHFRPAQESMARFVEESVPRLVVIAMKDPYDAAFFPKAAGLGAALGYSARAAETVARCLSGKFEARGRCPVSVIGIEV
jgi:beta-N-acetylhexosaminidase